MNSPNIRLSRYFTLEQLIHSDTASERGIDNTPQAEVIENLKLLAAGLDQVQELLGHPLEINSGFRCPTLNVAVGGAARSQHCQGLAADIECAAFGTPMQIAQAIAQSVIQFDQCIMEFGRWVHLSFGAMPRRRLLTIYSGEEGYLAGLFDRDGIRVA